MDIKKCKTLVIYLKDLRAIHSSLLKRPARVKESIFLKAYEMGHLEKL